jgi:predicted nucleotidyltransferase component of viral defense system
MFFGNYRFSEDLDFTITKSSQFNIKFLEKKFKTISDWVYDQAGIELPIEEINFRERNNDHDFNSIKGKITYKGPIARLGSAPRIKLDLTTDELLVTQSIKSKVLHDYSDYDPSLFEISSYSYLEIFAEKLRAIAQRSLPRDLYDIVEIYKKETWSSNQTAILKILIKKCEYKNIQVPNKELLKDLNKIAEIKSASGITH